MTSNAARVGPSAESEVSGPQPVTTQKAGEDRSVCSPKPLDLTAPPLWSQLGDGRPLVADERERYERLLDRPVDGVRVHE